MNHGTCEKLIWYGISKNACGRPAKYKCVTPSKKVSMLACGIHRRWCDDHGWTITYLEREAKMKAEGNV